ncbi:MAG: hypothetical protein Q6373_014805 [Candidatus Sigynarchaeota archaeon]
MVEDNSKRTESLAGADGPVEPRRGEPRIGRRDSEPHSEEVSYLYDVLRTNYPGSRATWDLHHHFKVDGEEIDIQLDVSFFHGWRGPNKLSSYNASEHGGRVPDVAINILSKGTWKDDIGENVDVCRMAKIPVYVVFAPFHVASKTYKPPFLRVYRMGPGGRYSFEEKRGVAMKHGSDAIDWHETVDCGEHVPFRFGLMELAETHDKGWPLYRLVLLDAEKKAVLLSSLEQEKQRAEQEKQRADRLQAELNRLRKPVE